MFEKGSLSDVSLGKKSVGPREREGDAQEEKKTVVSVFVKCEHGRRGTPKGERFLHLLTSLNKRPQCTSPAASSVGPVAGYSNKSAVTLTVTSVAEPETFLPSQLLTVIKIRGVPYVL